jgi:MFS family permease
MLSIEQRREWKAHATLPFLGMLGVAGCVVKPFTSGVMIGPVTHAFGWSRAEFSSGFTLQTIILLLISPIVGRTIDRFGPRNVALAGLPPALCTLGLLGTANGQVWQWQLLCVLQALAGAFIAAPVWVTAITRRFNTSRGLALAFTLAGVALGSMIWPIVTALFVEQFGWRLTFPALAFSWGIVFFPLAVIFLPRDQTESDAPETDPRPWGEIGANLLSRPVICVVAAGALFSIVTMGINLHLIPILQDRGFGLTAAAALAGVAGFSSLAGRILTGFLLDRLPTRLLGIVAFLLPVIVSVLLSQGGGSLAAALPAVVIFGLASGAETDIVTFMVSRRVPLEIFGSVYSVVSSIFALCAGIGPLYASALFDLRGNYALYLLTIAPIVTLGAFLIWLAPAHEMQPRAAGAPA